jgi:uncharacterized RmlC-like cupin family protein
MYTEYLKCFSDERGNLYPLNFNELPFFPKRCFFITNVPKNFERGNHAHFTTKQYLICLSGKVDVILFDGKKEHSHTLEKGNSIYIPELVWDKQIFKEPNTVILVLASTEYDQNDYILSLEKFINIIK